MDCFVDWGEMRGELPVCGRFSIKRQGGYVIANFLGILFDCICVLVGVLICIGAVDWCFDLLFRVRWDTIVPDR